MKHRGGSVLITSPAKYGVDLLAAKSSWPLTFTFGLVRERPVVRAGHLAVAPTFHLCLQWDRRLQPGAVMARFFARVVAHLEQPQLGVALVEPQAEGLTEAPALGREAA